MHSKGIHGKCDFFVCENCNFLKIKENAKFIIFQMLTKTETHPKMHSIDMCQCGKLAP